MKKQSITILILLSGLLLFSGCASERPATVKLSQENRSRLVEQDLSRTFNRTLNVLQNRGFTIALADRSEGLIYTEYQLASTLRTPFKNNDQIRVEAKLESLEQGTRIRLFIRIKREITLIGNLSQVVNIKQTKRYYRDLLDEVTRPF